ncbi:MAG: TonB-dependent receptor [Bacteroidales bacterium]|nr:TonB-dependent receptor [Bacteroidales bacterium]
MQSELIRKITVIVIFFMLPGVLSVSAQVKTLKGKVTDEAGLPLIGAGIVSPDGKTGTVTDLDGNYSLDIPEGVSILTFSYIGYASKEIILDGKAILDVQLLPDKSNVLNDVVVIGYGTTKKMDLTGSVTSVKMDDLENLPVSSIDQALQGKVAGMDVMSTSGEPGATTSIRIRGTRSITASNEPLIVVDGIIDAVESLNDINPDDIATVSVLKDASSTAIYGSRGANGVIMVTTRKGKSSRPSIKAKVQYGISMMARQLDIMNAEEYVRYRNDISTKGGLAPQLPKINLDEYGGRNTNWMDEISRIAHYQNYNISMNGNSGGFKYNFSLGYNDEQGIIKGSGVKRGTANINLTKDVTKWMDISLKVYTFYLHQDLNKAIFSGTSYGQGAIYLSPLMTREDRVNPLLDNGTRFNNPIARVEMEDFYRTSLGNTEALSFDIHPVKWLKINSQNSMYTNQQHRYHFWPSTMPLKVEGEGADAEKYEMERMKLASENTVTFLPPLPLKHKLDIMLGYSASSDATSNTKVKAEGLIMDKMKWDDLNAIQSKSNYTISSDKYSVRRQSVFARVNYNFLNRYYLTMTARTDGSSNFAANRKWAFFPSMALKYNIKNEAFFKRQFWLDNLSLRASVGRTGNDAISSYKSMQYYSSSAGGYIFNGEQQLMFAPAQLENPDLTWETTDSYNIALEAAFFRNRINTTIEYYGSRTTDLLLQVDVPRQTGYTSRFTNLGMTTNQGIEFTLETVNIEKKKFGWTTSFTLSHNKQMVRDIGHANYVPVLKCPGNQKYMMYGYKAGYPLNSLWGFEYGGVVKNSEEFIRNQETKQYVYGSNLTKDTAPGYPRYVDQNNDGVLNNDDLVYLGNADPVIYGGLQNNFSIGPVKMRLYFTYSLGGKIYNFSELFMGGSSSTNQYRYMLDAWHVSRNPDSDIPRAGTAQNMLPASNFVHDASYLRLQNVMISYTLDARKWTKVFRYATISLNAYNVFLLTRYNGFDPDVSTNSGDSALRRVAINDYPKSRQFTATLQITF